MTRFTSLALGAAFLSSLTYALPSNTPLNTPRYNNVKNNCGPPPSYGTPHAISRAQAVVDVFKTSWDGYYTYAFPSDELEPVNNTASNSRNGWGASAVDALSTALLMGETETVNQILEHIPTIDWSQTSDEVSLFETTIRYLGGMLSGYDLLSGPLSHLADDPANVDALLAQAINLANNLSYAFETPSGVPWNNLDFATRGNDGSENGLATVGTLILEWVRLADLSGNETYRSLVHKAENYLIAPSPASSEPFPGLLGTNINVTTGLFTDAKGGWVGGSDSFYEYLIKMYIYNPRYELLRDRWIAAADSTIKYLTSHPVSRPDLTFVAAYDGTTLRLRSQHLACFDGGNFILGGQVLGIEKYINYGLALVEGCHDTYTSTATGIGPEQFAWDPTSVPANQSGFFNTSGFYITDPSYDLRPEVIESFYYAYRATSDPKYQDWAWEAFVAINATTRVGSGYSAITNVNAPDGGDFSNFQESFWFAEVLKYSYLIQAPEAEWQVSKYGKNEWVFNTEAHPVRVSH
ncbi:mannosyl-oligosaccharide alpha-1,2-mannosidase-like protein [Clathrospora elynae]|uniref:alpha-1,2-Mannosidase n=1 Tax=Clathrospora elynae TaxID=706981 RepID=A0A6A5T0L0_9PLEO|nr:mannosyl-oligosaccharide alpha-1,2-mannosidase-like protein [Clathrospora elynae]